MKGGESMTEQERQKIEEVKENTKKMISDFFSSITERVREAVKALQTYPDKRVVNKALYGKTEKIRQKNLKKIFDWYRRNHQ